MLKPLTVWITTNWKVLKEMGIPDHLTCLLRNLYAGQEATVRTGHERTDWFQIWKGVCQGCILSPCLFNLYAEYIMWNARLDEAQDGIKIAGRNINNLRYADDTTLMAESEEELKSLLINMKENSEKADLKLDIQKMKIMAFSPITSWHKGGETMETVRDFISLDSKITGDCSHEIKRRLLLGRKAMTNLCSILKSRAITLPTEISYRQSYGFFWQLCTESWTIKKVECWKNWCFWTVVLRKTLESSWDCKEIKPVNPKGNQPWVFIGKTDVKGETLILWLADAKSWFIGKDHDAGKDWGQEQREQQRMRWLDGITDS